MVLLTILEVNIIAFFSFIGFKDFTKDHFAFAIRETHAGTLPCLKHRTKIPTTHVSRFLLPVFFFFFQNTCKRSFPLRSDEGVDGHLYMRWDGLGALLSRHGLSSCVLNSRPAIPCLLNLREKKDASSQGFFVIWLNNINIANNFFFSEKRTGLCA